MKLYNCFNDMFRRICTIFRVYLVNPVFKTLSPFRLQRNSKNAECIQWNWYIKFLKYYRYKQKRYCTQLYLQNKTPVVYGVWWLFNQTSCYTVPLFGLGPGDMACVLARHARNMVQTPRNMSFKQLHNFKSLIRLTFTCSWTKYQV
jgi:hypothetical protein